MKGKPPARKCKSAARKRRKVEQELGGEKDIALLAEREESYVELRKRVATRKEKPKGRLGSPFKEEQLSRLERSCADGRRGASNKTRAGRGRETTG